jgi:hypothetical protein
VATTTAAAAAAAATAAVAAGNTLKLANTGNGSHIHINQHIRLFTPVCIVWVPGEVK